MGSLRRASGVVVILLLSALPARAQSSCNCLPTYDPTDARFLAISGSNLANPSISKLDLGRAGFSGPPVVSSSPDDVRTDVSIDREVQIP